MPFTYGTNNIKIFNVNSILIGYRTGVSTLTHSITADKVEQGVSMQHSTGSSVVISSGADIPKSEKVVISFTVIGSATDMNTVKNIINKNPLISIGLSELTVYLDNGAFFTIADPECNISRTVKGNDITKMVVNCEISGGDADTIMEWSS